jgi:transposase
VSGVDELTRQDLIRLLGKQQETILRQEERIRLLEEHVGELEEEIAQLKSKLAGKGSSMPEWLKANRAGHPKRDRKKRKKSFTRRRETPTEVCKHVLDRCPECGRKLCGGWVHHRRQVIEIPVNPVRIIEHEVWATKCGVCRKVWIPKLDLCDEVVGKHRVGINLMSLVAHLAIAGRMPLGGIQTFLKAVYQLHLAKGELAEILHTVAKYGQGEYDKLREDVRGSPAVSADETGWREDGINGYIWSFSTPRVRYFVHNQSRGSKVPREVLGQEFGGVVGCDFYSGYSPLDVERQRCWVHFLGDVKELVQGYSERQDVAEWAKKVRGVYRRAKRFRSNVLRVRIAAKMRFEQELLGLAVPYLSGNAPQRQLAHRIEKFIAELFVFVEKPEVPSENNAAERSIRPAVIARKISGGTRSVKGSSTRMTLMSLFGTWKLRGLNTMHECRKMLLNSQPTAAVRPASVALSHEA